MSDCHTVTQCPRCQSPHFKRNGHIRGEQYFLCHGCRRSFTARTGKSLNRIRRQAEYQQFVKEFPARRGLRQDAARLKVSVASVWRWRHRVLAEKAQSEAESEPQLEGEVAVSCCTLDADRAYWSWWSNDIWHRYWGPKRKSPPQAGPTTVLFVAQSTPLDDYPTWTSRRLGSSEALGLLRPYEPIRARCLVLPGIPSRSDFSVTLSKVLKPGTMAQTPRGRLQVPKAGEHPPQHRRSPEFDAEGNPVYIPEFFYDEHVRWMTFGQKHPFVDRTRLRILRGAFYRWMIPFRGVAVKYLHRYVAWFNLAVATAADLAFWARPNAHRLMQATG